MGHHNEVDHLDTVRPPCLCSGRTRVQPLRQGGEGVPWRSEAQDPLCRWLPAQVPMDHQEQEPPMGQIDISDILRYRYHPLTAKIYNIRPNRYLSIYNAVCSSLF